MSIASSVASSAASSSIAASSIAASSTTRTPATHPYISSHVRPATIPSTKGDLRSKRLLMELVNAVGGLAKIDEFPAMRRELLELEERFEGMILRWEADDRERRASVEE